MQAWKRAWAFGQGIPMLGYKGHGPERGSTSTQPNRTPGMGTGVERGGLESMKPGAVVVPLGLGEICQGTMWKCHSNLAT